MVSIVPNKIQIEHDRTGINVETLKRAFLDNLLYIQAKFPKIATKNDYYMALAYTVRDRLLNRWLHTSQTYLEKAPRGWIQSLGLLQQQPRTEASDRSHRFRLLLPWRPKFVQAAVRLPALSRRVPAVGRLSILRRMPGSSKSGIPRSG